MGKHWTERKGVVASFGEHEGVQLSCSLFTKT